MKECQICGDNLSHRKSHLIKYCDDCREIRNKQLDDEATERKRIKREKAVGSRLCEDCKKVELSNDRRQVCCSECSKERDRISKTKHKRAKRITEKRRIRNEMDINFNQINPSEHYLLPNSFDTISPIPSDNYRRRFLGGWVSVLKRHGKLEEFRDYIVEAYISWSEKTGSQTVKLFYKDIGVSWSMMDQVMLGNELRSLAGFSKYGGFSDDEYNEEFLRVLSCFEDAPTWSEFIGESKISLYSFAKNFGYTGEVYVHLLQHYDVSKEVIDRYIERQSKQRSIRNSELLTGKYKISEEELIVDFKNTFDSFLKNYGVTPTISEFDRLAKYGKHTLTGRLNTTYSEMAKSLGYDHDVSGSPSELVTLEGFSSVLKSQYLPQAKFDWLKSDLGKNLRCDGYFDDYKLVVEYDGRQHSQMVEYFGQESYDRTVANDAIKNALIPQHGISLLRIAYNEPYWDEDFLRMRLLESGITPLNHTVINDSTIQSKAA